MLRGRLGKDSALPRMEGYFEIFFTKGFSKLEESQFRIENE